MKIEGLQKLTLLDYPGKVACTVFFHGCNFRCPFCHNAPLVTGQSGDGISKDELERFFAKRKNILDGVCVTGGEALCQKDIGEFLAFVKSFGFSVKLDTNGSFPDTLAELINKGLVDYVAMDIKSSPENYSACCGVNGFDISSVKKSVELLMNGNVPYEFRTTAVKGLHTIEDFVEIGKWIRGARAYFIQQFVDSGMLIGSGFSAFDAQTMESFADAVRPFVTSVSVRGV